MSEPKFKIGQRVRRLLRPKNVGTVVEMNLHNPPLYKVALDGQTYGEEKGMVFNQFEIEAI